jgi:hypothetical protein
MMDLHAEGQPGDHDPLDRDHRPRGAASGAGLGREVVAHRSLRMQSAGPRGTILASSGRR